MDWRSHLVVAEAVRLGAKLWCNDSAAAPFAAELVGVDCHGIKAGWCVIGYPGGQRCLARSPEPSALPADAVIAVVGPLEHEPAPLAQPAIWLDPPETANAGHMRPICPEMPGLLVEPAKSDALSSAISDFAAGLVSGVVDPWDWLQKHIAGRRSLHALSWDMPGYVSCEVDPLTTVMTETRAEAEALVLSGVARLSRQRPLRLRLPMLTAPGVRVAITVRNSGDLNARVETDGASVHLEQVRVPDGQEVVLSATVGITWVDLRLEARRGEVAMISLRLPVDGNEDLGVADPLERYGDPLDAYVGTNVK